MCINYDIDTFSLLEIFCKSISTSFYFVKKCGYGLYRFGYMEIEHFRPGIFLNLFGDFKTSIIVMTKPFNYTHIRQY